jgi:deoxyribodipyrimidine photolyase-related protein
MKEIVIILPHQLFADNPLLDKKKEIHLIEHPRYFTDFNFHKQKLLLHRASMQEYYDQLKNSGYTVEYIEFKKAKKNLESLAKKSVVHIIDPIDHALKKELESAFETQAVHAHWYESPMFLTSSEWIAKNLAQKKMFLMHTFYMQQRKRLNILMVNGKPAGGKWSFDKENQESIPDSVRIPQAPKPYSNTYIAQAQEYVTKHFSKNPGSMDSFIYPTNTREAKKRLSHFLEHDLKLFGTYQDAIKKEESFLFHSILTPALNTGLLTPAYVIETTLDYAKKHQIPLNSLEGFIRQIIGWREFVRALYQLKGQEQKNANFFDNQENVPPSMYDASTGIDPIDCTIKKVLKTGYSHHIERLMILGNFMLLAQIKPNDVYTWFMEMYIDSYDWVMVPNVYGMSQYAYTHMTTKPYIASSKYILNMSDYEKGPWSTIWDALFWSFMKKHQRKLELIPRMQFMLSALKKKSLSQMKEYETLSQQWKKKSRKG